MILRTLREKLIRVLSGHRTWDRITYERESEKIVQQLGIDGYIAEVTKLRDKVSFYESAISQMATIMKKDS